MIFQVAQVNIAAMVAPLTSDPVTLFHLSVWESPDALKQFTYRSTQSKLFVWGADWFSANGDAEFAFTYRRFFDRPNGRQSGAAAC